MGNFVIALLLLVFSLTGIALRKIYYYLPAKELKRQAENGDALAAVLWRAVSYGASLHVLLWLWIGLGAAAGFVVLAHIAPWPIAFTATALLLWISFAWFPRREKVSGVEARVAMWLTPGVSWLLNYLHPVFDHTLAHLIRRYPEDTHTNLFESQDLLDLIDRQKDQTDNRISHAELQRVAQALTARARKVHDVLTPRKEVKSVSDSDTVGLVLLDELHASGQSSFPVYKGKTDKIIGTLYLRDLNLQTEGKVRDYMTKDVRYLHEDDSLTQALQAFFKTKQQLFVVVNDFEEYVGVLTLEQLVQRLMGDMPKDSFDQHDDLAAVANKHAYDTEEPEAETEPAHVPVPEATADLPEPEPETELITEEPIEAEPEEALPEIAANEDGAETDEPEDSVVTEEVSEEPTSINPDELAALDLPDEEEKPAPKVRKSKSKTAKSDDEVVE